jgi:hypothetical protein
MRRPVADPIGSSRDPEIARSPGTDGARVPTSVCPSGQSSPSSGHLLSCQSRRCSVLHVWPGDGGGEGFGAPVVRPVRSRPFPTHSLFPFPAVPPNEGRQRLPIATDQGEVI